jgi:hypothetical protein
MKMKIFSCALAAVFSATGALVGAPTIKETIASINADASKPDGAAKAVKSISKSTGVPAATLESQKASTGLTYGDIFAAHALAKASGKTFNQIVSLKAKGQTWDKIAEDNNVSLGGQKKVAKTDRSAASPSPSAVKTQAQLQKERWSHQTEITNVPKPKATPKP